MSQHLNTLINTAPNSIAITAVLKRLPEPVLPKNEIAQHTDACHLTIAELISEITKKAENADDQTIRSAFLMRELRKRVEGGKLGPEVKWYEWALKNLDMRVSRLKELQRIAKAKEPRAELERLRNLATERVKRYVANAEISPEMQMRARVARFAKKAHADQVRILDDLVYKMTKLH
jgi:hypothetical protein